MALVNFSNLEFEQIKASIRDYLRSNSNFTDYDFEGSNLSIIIDTLAYNTYISSYNANMLSNEVFIDSATLRENVVSLARNIGYVPRSRIAPKAAVSFFVDVSNLSLNPVSLTLQRGIVATTQGRFGGVNYTFISPDNVTVPVVDNIANFNNVSLYEGAYITQNFTVDTANTTQRFVLDNANIDTSSIRVTVKDTVSSTYAQKYQLATSIFEIKPTSQVFYIQEIEDQRYELFFGDGFFGRKLQNNNYIEVSYIVTNGEDANGVDAFSFVGRVLSNNGTVVTSDISLMSVNTAATGGSEIESVASIKKYAPRIYASQSRAVTAQDYEALIPTIYPEAESVSVFGGEELSPPKYGKVFITIKPSFGPFVPNAIKDNLKTELRKYSVAGIVPEILDLKYLYIEVASKIYYNTNLAPSANYIKAIVNENVNDYADSSELNKYGARFKYSKFLKIIDDSHESITSNITLVQMRRDLRATLNKFTEYEICYGNGFHIKDLKNGYNIKSSGFYIDGVSEVVYLSDIPNSDGITGSLFIFRLLSDTQVKVIRKSVGTINYEKGEILLNPIKITKTEKFRGESLIEISAIPKSNDVIGLQDLYLQLDINNTTFDMVSDDISSGGDPSGSNYIVSSSYLNGDLVRK